MSYQTLIAKLLESHSCVGLWSRCWNRLFKTCSFFFFFGFVPNDAFKESRWLRVFIPPPFHSGRWRWIAACCSCHVLFVLPVTSQMSPGKTAAIFPRGSSLQTFLMVVETAGPAWRTASGSHREREGGGRAYLCVQLRCLHDKFYLYFYRQMLLNWKFCSPWLATGAMAVRKTERFIRQRWIAFD